MSSNTEPNDVDEFALAEHNTPNSTEFSDSINKLDHNNPEKYLVEWSGAGNMDYKSAYDVTEIGFGTGGAPNIKIEGKRGGKYTIDSNPSGRPKVIRQSDGYEERLSHLKIYTHEFEWEHWIKKRLGIE